LRSLGKEFFIIVTIVAIALLIFLFLKDRENKLIYSLLIAGSLGNLVDRFQHGYVIDFIDLFIGRFHWPAFNIADISLTMGIFLLIYKTIWGNRKGLEIN
jgi:signal peptidase II